MGKVPSRTRVLVLTALFSTLLSGGSSDPIPFLGGRVDGGSTAEPPKQAAVADQGRLRPPSGVTKLVKSTPKTDRDLLPPPPVPPKRKPFTSRPPPPPPLPSAVTEAEIQPETENVEVGHGTDEGLYGNGMFEGDIVTSSSGRNAVSDPNLRWPAGAVVFKVDDSVGCPDSPQCEILMKAMNHYHKRACVRFKEWTGETNNVNVFFNTESSGSCWSSVGRTGEVEQALSLGERCWYLGIVIHELGHAIGFWHEMNRPDRDDWIWVYWDNIIPGFQSAFDKNEPSTVNSLGEDFDYKSIMMYDEYAFSKDGVSATLQAKQEGTVIGPIWKKKGLSDSDVRRLHMLYQCQENRPLPGFPYDINCDFNYHQCGFKNGGSPVWNWKNVNATDGYVCAEYEEGGATTGFLQSINFHPLEAVNDQVESSVNVFGCLRFWYYIDSNADAQLMVWHAYLDRVTQLAYDPDKVFELWEDGNITSNWVHVDIPLYVSRPFKLIFVSSFNEGANSGTIALDDIELLYSPCLEEPEEANPMTMPSPIATTEPSKPLVPKPTIEQLENYCPDFMTRKEKPRHEL